MITKIWYSVQNGGDGSAYPKLVNSKELAELDQKYPLYGDGWGESCTGWITIESDGPIIIKDEVATVESEIKEIEEDACYPEGHKYFPNERYKALKKLKEKINGF